MQRSESTPATRSQPPGRIERGARLVLLLAVAALALGMGLVALGILPRGMVALQPPVVMIIGAATVVAFGAGALRSWRNPGALRHARTSLELGIGMFMIGHVGAALEWWSDHATAVLMFFAIALVGAALLVDAWRDGRRPAVPRQAVRAAALGGAGMLLMGVSELAGRAGGGVWDWTFFAGVALIAAAAASLLGLRMANPGWAESLGSRGAGDR